MFKAIKWNAFISLTENPSIRKKTTHTNVESHKPQNWVSGLVDSQVGKWVPWLWGEEGRPTHGSEHTEPSLSPTIRLHPAAEYDNASIFHPPDVTH